MCLRMPRQKKLRLTLLSVLLARHGWAWSCDDENATTQLTKKRLTEPEAVCNDGTSAAYYWKRGSDPMTYLIYLGGGGQCWDMESCRARYNGTAYPYHDCYSSSTASPCFMSSKDYGSTCNKTGIFSEDPLLNPALATATKLYVPYCTSDAHVGNGMLGDWQFRGKKVVEAVLADAARNLGMGLVEGTRLVFGGGSAGGRGALVWLDAVAKSVPTTVSVVGFLDSPYYLDLQPYASSTFVGFPTLTNLSWTNFNASATVEAGTAVCTNVFFQSPWKCAMGQYAAPFVTQTPHLVVASQFDAWQISNSVLGFNGIVFYPGFDEDQLEYVLSFGEATKGSLSNTLAMSTAVVSPACYSHHLSEMPNFWADTTIDNASQASALADLLLRGVVGRHIDDCDGFNCGVCTS